MSFNVVLVDSTTLFAVVRNDTAFVGYPMTDLKTAMETANELNQMGPQINLVGTVFGVVSGLLTEWVEISRCLLRFAAADHGRPPFTSVELCASHRISAFLCELRSLPPSRLRQLLPCQASQG
ncbi:hypothetical protein RJT34_03407 [Clitoria ternatea]|uniref:Uncharacterized protein n=1 Tax=Clitoria ternatea TaxID=43366 RepID=A0AAN9KLL3_CLITE